MKAIPIEPTQEQAKTVWMLRSALKAIADGRYDDDEIQEVAKDALMRLDHLLSTIHQPAAQPQCSTLCVPAEPCSITEDGKCDAAQPPQQGALENFFVQFGEFVSDWKMGDFDLPELAALDMNACIEAWQACSAQQAAQPQAEPSAQEDAKRLDSGCILLVGLDEMGDCIEVLHTGFDLRAAIDAALRKKGDEA